MVSDFNSVVFKVIKNSDINFADIMIFVFKQEDYQKRFSWLSAIDPYGLTMINELQKDNLIKDLETLQAFSDIKLKNLIQESINFISQIGDLEFIQFIGD